MAGLLLSHTGSWVDASHFEGTITLDPTTAIHPAIVGVELAYGDPTGMSISVSGMAFYPASASGPLVAGTRYFATGDGSNTVTYVVVAPAATTLVMSAHTSPRHDRQLVRLDKSRGDRLVPADRIPVHCR